MIREKTCDRYLLLSLQHLLLLLKAVPLFDQPFVPLQPDRALVKSLGLVVEIRVVCAFARALPFGVEMIEIVAHFSFSKIYSLM